MAETYRMRFPLACLTFYSSTSFVFHAIQFLFLTLAIKTRLSKLNELMIESFLNDTMGNDPKRQVEILEGVGLIYDKLVDVCEQISRVYGVSVVIKNFQLFQVFYELT